MNGVNVNIMSMGGMERGVDGMQEDISLTEIRKGVHKLKNGKAAGVDEVYAEMIKCSGGKALEWL